MKIVTRPRVAFLFTVNLAISLFLVGARLDLTTLPFPLLALNVVLAILLAGTATVIQALLIAISWWLWRRLLRVVLSLITMFTLRRSVNAFTKPVEAQSIGEQEGNLVVRLPLGHDLGMEMEQLILAKGSATGELLGVLEPLSVEGTSCLCFIFDRISIDFWQGLEDRMKNDFSPPNGVIFSRQVPEGFTEFAERVVLSWRN